MNIEITQATVDDAEKILLYYKDILEENLSFILSNPVPTLDQEIKFIQDHSTDYFL
ncbi:MAG: hypothetical protein GY710_07235 [Desulfobacteraceae bacterium]|nr:hypothetical protein [Desulfobacteraceae bacterium]